MRQSFDISSVVNAIKLDIQDTVSKLYKGRNSLSNMAQLSVIAQQYNGSVIPQTEYDNLLSEMNELVADLTSSDWSVGNTLLSSSIVIAKERANNLSNHAYNYELNVQYNDAQKNFKMYLDSAVNGDGDYVITSKLLVDDTEVTSPDYVFEDAQIGGRSICSIVSTINEGLTTNDFLLDICSSIKNPANLNNVLNKWVNFSNASTAFKENLSQAISELDGTPSSILAWLKRVYTEMSQTTYVDDELSFSSTSFIVKSGFYTVGQILAGAIGAAVTAIGLVIGKVAAIIGMCLSALISAISNAVQNRINPLITVKTNYNPYNDFLPLPVAQVTKNNSQDYGYYSSDEEVFFRINSLLTTTRCFKNKGSNQFMKFETFLKCSLTGKGVISLVWWSYNNLPIMVARKGLFGEDWMFNEVTSGISEDNVNEYCNSFNLCDCQTEYSQANLVMANLALYALCYLPLDTPSQSDNFSAALNRIKQGVPNYTQQDVLDVCYWYLNSLSDIVGGSNSNNTQRYFYGDGIGTHGDSVHTENLHKWNWDEVINDMIPAVRRFSSYMMTPSDSVFFNSAVVGQYLTANNAIENLESSINRLVSFAGPDGFQQYESPFLVPKYTGSDAIKNIVLSVLTIAITVAVAVTATIVLKRLTTKMLVTKTQKLLNLKNINDQVSSDPQATEAQKNTAYSNYYRAVKAYNRFSWLWSGGTWSIANGWVDYASSPVSASTFAESLNTALSDTITTVSVDDNGNLEKTSNATASVVDDIQETSATSAVDCADIKRLISAL